jgi:hypothetical protein
MTLDQAWDVIDGNPAPYHRNLRFRHVAEWVIMTGESLDDDCTKPPVADAGDLLRISELQ